LFGVEQSLDILLHEPQVILNKRGNKFVPLLEEVTTERKLSFIFEHRSHKRPIVNNMATESTEFVENVRKIVREFEEVISIIRETKHGSASKLDAMCQS
jgi:hypothetical protein